MSLTSRLAPVLAGLNRLAADPPLFRALCVPMAGQRVPVDQVDPQILDGLLAGGVVAVHGERVAPRIWVALRAGRPYFMSLRPADAKGSGQSDIYTQDVWPETEALLQRVAVATVPGSFLEIGVGSGPVAITAALGGHTVTATDLHEETLELAAWNAALHGVELELIAGDMCQPVAGRRFDLVLSAPHYGGAFDQLRLQMLRDGIALVAPGGALFVATQLELDMESGRYGVVDALLAPIAAAGASVTVRALPRTPLKSRWCTYPVPPVPGVVARHRFTVEIRPDGPPGLTVIPPAAADLERKAFVPLARITDAGARAEIRAGLDEHTAGAWNRRPSASVTTVADVAALERLLTECATGVVALATPIPFMLHDGCRFGGAACDAVYRGIVDAAGGVRPCSHGEVVGRAGDTAIEYRARMAALHEALVVRRGCATCSARSVCSQCTFPAVLEERAYCDLIRRHAVGLPRMQQLLSMLVERFPEANAWSDALIKLAPAERLVAARRRPVGANAAQAGDESLVWLAARIAEGKGALVFHDGEAYLDVTFSPTPYQLAPVAAEILELVMEGASLADLHAYAGERELDPDAVDGLLGFVGRWIAE